MWLASGLAAKPNGKHACVTWGPKTRTASTSLCLPPHANNINHPLDPSLHGTTVPAYYPRMAELAAPDPSASPQNNTSRRPVPDVAMYETQQEFLDSLVPIPVDAVEKDDLKCAFCWRPYGESNPGRDDAEQPVRFSCSHVFGEQCMRSLFAVRKSVRIDLVPLSFEPGSKGADLGGRLNAYVCYLRNPLAVSAYTNFRSTCTRWKELSPRQLMTGNRISLRFSLRCWRKYCHQPS